MPSYEGGCFQFVIKGWYARVPEGYSSENEKKKKADEKHAPPILRT